MGHSLWDCMQMTPHTVNLDVKTLSTFSPQRLSNYSLIHAEVFGTFVHLRPIFELVLNQKQDGDKLTLQ